VLTEKQPSVADTQRFIPTRKKTLLFLKFDFNPLLEFRIEKKTHSERWISNFPPFSSQMALNVGTGDALKKRLITELNNVFIYLMGPMDRVPGSQG